jgi:hypothetical protein
MGSLFSAEEFESPKTNGKNREPAKEVHTPVDPVEMQRRLVEKRLSTLDSIEKKVEELKTRKYAALFPDGYVVG